MSKAKKGYYTRLVTHLLSKEEDFQPFASQSSGLSRSRCVEVRGKDTVEQSYGVFGTLPGNSVGTGLSDFKKEIFKSLLKQGVKILSPEVEEMLGSVVGISRLKSQLKSKKHLSSARGASPDVDARNTPSKETKEIFSSFSSTSLPALSTTTNPESSRENGAEGHTTETARFVVGAEEPKVDEALQTLIESDSGQVEETVKKDSDEFSATLGHMEQQLEKLLDTVMSSCRRFYNATQIPILFLEIVNKNENWPMTLGDKHKLGKLIQKLPPKNL